ncbi:DUF560 domain-containing protein [Pseudoalteromonas sp. MMG006]|uniref:surface lipoprotein assembly modifier n=1 Tax=Pseudoalteromonas sp. MMG006 TaxID=2822683 RepID=UPI001B36AD2B|nr:surface lipoprotein assembly modifier [Pseudoalteromonas sp. MMG006]MBQ4799503.1 DUF560 domain-containing protein [Pseudoalteromonas sp. MMG006]
MIKRLTSILLLSYVTLHSLNVKAQDDIPYVKMLGEIQYLISNKQYSKAYKQSQKYYKYLGEPDFDYLLGISALNSGVSAPAVFAFERVVEDKPQWYEARLYLIKSYITANNLPAANSQALALIHNKTASDRVKTAAQNLLEISQNKQRVNARSFNQSIEFAYGKDGNVNAGTSEDTILIPNLGEFLLSPDSKSTDDSYVKLNYRGHYLHPIDQQSALSVGISTDWYKFSELSQYDRINTRLSARYQQQLNNTRWYVQAGVIPLLLDGELYRTETSVVGGANYQLDKQLSLFSAVTLGHINNSFDEKLDNSFYSLNIGASYMSSSWLHSVSANHKSEIASIDTGDFNARNINGVYYQVTALLGQQWQLSAQTGYQWIEYQDEHPLFMQDRDDSLLILSSSLRYLVTKQLAVQLALNYQDKTSNISLFEYDRFDTNLSASYSF